MEENFISQNQFTVILAMDTSQNNRRAGTFCTNYNWYNRHEVEWTKIITNLLSGRRHRSVGVMKSAPNLTSWRVWYQEFETWTCQPTTAIGENQNQW